MHRWLFTGRRWGVAAVAIAALFAQLISLTLHAPQATRIELAAKAAGLHTVVICTAHGASTITIDAQGNPVEAPAAPDPRNLCQMCAALGAFAVATPGTGATLPTSPATTAVHSRDSNPWIIGRTGIIHRNRGPPRLAIV